MWKILLHPEKNHDNNYGTEGLTFISKYKKINCVYGFVGKKNRRRVMITYPNPKMNKAHSVVIV
jgi:hypothetical protein